MNVPPPSVDCTFNPIILIPSYNPGIKGIETVRNAAKAFTPLLVVSDGSTDGSDADIEAFSKTQTGVTLLRLPINRGKGSAVLEGVQWAKEQGFTHVLTMDADGQHPAARILDFMEVSRRHPKAMILGTPVFSEDAPMIRVKGRRISNWWANLETLWTGIGDSLFGFRMYPIAPLIAILQSNRWMRRFDFDPEVVVRLRWSGVQAINLPTEVRYPSKEEGGISHFHYGRDNVLLTAMHIRLLLEFLFRLPYLLLRRITSDR
jgi:glycosyltransferase involved in cell wall biosynthesis